MTPVNGAEASVPPGEQRIQERRVRSQRHRNYMSRTHLHTPPDLPEGYGESSSTNISLTLTFSSCSLLTSVSPLLFANTFQCWNVIGFPHWYPHGDQKKEQQSIYTLVFFRREAFCSWLGFCTASLKVGLSYDIYVGSWSNIWVFCSWI